MVRLHIQQSLSTDGIHKWDDSALFNEVDWAIPLLDGAYDVGKIADLMTRRVGSKCHAEDFDCSVEGLIVLIEVQDGRFYLVRRAA